MPFLLWPQRKDDVSDQRLSAREPSQLTLFDQNALRTNLQLLHTACDARLHAGADAACTTYMIPKEELLGKLCKRHHLFAYNLGPQAKLVADRCKRLS